MPEFQLDVSWDQLRLSIADKIAAERDGSTLGGSASLAGLTEDEWTADRVMWMCGLEAIGGRPVAGKYLAQ